MPVRILDAVRLIRSGPKAASSNASTALSLCVERAVMCVNSCDSMVPRASAPQARGLASRAQMKSSKRSEEHTSELQSLMRISYAVFCLKKKTQIIYYTKHASDLQRII